MDRYKQEPGPVSGEGRGRAMQVEPARPPARRHWQQSVRREPSWGRDCNWQFFGRYRHQLLQNSIELIQLFHPGGTAKNGADIRLCLDAMEDVVQDRDRRSGAA